MLFRSLAETGIIGFILIFALFLVISLALLKNCLNIFCNKMQLFSNHKICLLIFYFTSLFPIAPSGNFFGNWLSAIYYIPAGFLIYLNKERINKI